MIKSTRFRVCISAWINVTASGFSCIMIFSHYVDGWMDGWMDTGLSRSDESGNRKMIRRNQDKVKITPLRLGHCRDGRRAAACSH
jgi:hypothetical protein